MAALEQSRNESADHRSEIDRLQRELAMSAEEHKRVEWNSARTIAELGRELHSTKERVMEQREKKENYKEHLRKMIKEKEDNDKRRSAETDEAVQELERKLEAQKAVQASVDARLESRNKEVCVFPLTFFEFKHIVSISAKINSFSDRSAQFEIAREKGRKS